MGPRLEKMQNTELKMTGVSRGARLLAELYTPVPFDRFDPYFAQSSEQPSPVGETVFANAEVSQTGLPIVEHETVVNNVTVTREQVQTS